MHPFPRQRVALFAMLVIVLPAAPAAAQPGKDKDPLSWDRNIHGLVQKYCLRCHTGADATGGVDLAQDKDPRGILAHRDTWESARAAVEAGQMPPEKAKQPSDEERRLLVAFLAETLDKIDCTAVDPGPPTIRRLNRVEYDAAVADLTGLDLRLGEGFPPDPTSYGFDTIGDALTLAPAQVEQYHAAARTIVAALTDGAADRAAAHDRVFCVRPGRDLAGMERTEREAARAVIERFATRAFRRPVEPAFMMKLFAVHDAARARGDAHEAAVGQALTAVLIAPRFLLRLEADQPDATGPYPVDGHELATRLAFFLWSRPPDEPLLELADSGELLDPACLERQTRRMLADPRGQALADNFLGQWLGLRDLDDHQVDAKRFPEFDGELRAAIREELRGQLGGIVRDNLPFTELIDGRHTWLNERLARHYGIDGVTGAAMRRVALPDRRRGGVLTTAAVLMLQADPGRTNVPRRGNFVADRIIGDPPPPPPPTVPALEDAAAADATVSLRDLLERHRRDAACAGCHARIDPFGFALEHYDAIGRWRDEEAGRPVDATGELADGTRIAGPVALKDLLLERRSAFARTLAKNMLVYALGRGLVAEDECVVREIVAGVEAGRHGVADMAVAVVQSVPFRQRRNAE
jgi:hypothetical protein